MKALRALGIGIILAAATAVPASAYVPNPTVDEALESVNKIRASVGSCPLSLDPKVSDVAEGWSRAMSGAGRLSHNTPLLGFYGVRAENVGYGMNVAQLNALFVRSPRHFVNLTNPTYSAIGIGISKSGPITFATYDFIATDGVERHC